MTVTLLRHVEVDYSWRSLRTSAEFAIAVREYDAADVKGRPLALPFQYPVAFVSTSRRALQTLNLALGEASRRSTELLVEVPVAPFVETDLRVPTAIWFLVGRLQWALNIHRQPETREDSLARAAAFVEVLRATDANCLVVSHGLFLRVLSRRLVESGFRGKKLDFVGHGEHHTYTRPSGAKFLEREREKQGLPMADALRRK